MQAAGVVADGNGRFEVSRHLGWRHLLRPFTDGDFDRSVFQVNDALDRILERKLTETVRCCRDKHNPRPCRKEKPGQESPGPSSVIRIAYWQSGDAGNTTALFAANMQY